MLVPPAAACRRFRCWALDLLLAFGGLEQRSIFLVYCPAGFSAPFGVVPKSCSIFRRCVRGRCLSDEPERFSFLGVRFAYRRLCSASPLDTPPHTCWMTVRLLDQSIFVVEPFSHYSLNDIIHTTHSHIHCPTIDFVTSVS